MNKIIINLNAVWPLYAISLVFKSTTPILNIYFPKVDPFLEIKGITKKKIVIEIIKDIINDIILFFIISLVVFEITSSLIKTLLIALSTAFL